MSLQKVYRIEDCRTDEQCRREAELSGNCDRSPTLHNLRLNALFELTDWSDDDLDIITEMRCGESWVTNDGYKITRQDS